MSLKNKLGSTSKLLERAKNSSKSVLSIPLENILVDEKQVRTVFNQEGLEGLAKSLKNQGQIEPIVVSPKDTDGNYRIQKGERRYRAAKIAGLEAIEAIVNDPQDLSKNALLMQQLAENIQREDLTPAEIAHTLQKLHSEDGMSKKEIAESLGKSQAWVSQHFSFIDAPECIQMLIDAGKANDATTVSELIKLHKTTPDKCVAYCESVVSEDTNVSRVEVKKLRSGGGVEDKRSNPYTKTKPVKTNEKKPAKKKVLVKVDGEEGEWEFQIAKSMDDQAFVKQGLVGKFVSPEQIKVLRISG